MNGWELPKSVQIDGCTYAFHGDYRDILEIFSYLNDPELPEYLRWQIALALFYETPIPQMHTRQAMEYLAQFICGGAKEQAQGPRLLDWEQDAAMIAADINKVAGQEVRALPFVHWWTFLSWFHAIGQGQLSAVISIRDKLYRGKKLEQWEKDFYRANRETVELKKRLSPQEQAHRDKLQAMLGR